MQKNEKCARFVLKKAISKKKKIVTHIYEYVSTK